MLSLRDRLSYLRKLREIFSSNEDNIRRALFEDLKRSEFEFNVSEFYVVLHEIDYFIKNLNRLSKNIKVRTPWYLFNTKSYLYPEAYGKVLIISPWNFPFQLTFLPLIGAIAAGNSVCVKPSEISKQSEKIICDIISEVFPADVAKVVTGDYTVVKSLLEQKFDLIFFTGSASKGVEVMHAAADNLTPVILELGGKSPAIVDDNVDVTEVAAKICRMKFSAAGQACIAIDYLLVHENIKDKLIKEIVEKIIQFWGRDPQSSSCYGKIINENHFARIIRLLESADVIYGGDFNSETCYISPTIVDNVKPSDSIMISEIFGPILPVISYAKINEAVDLINSNEKPLALYVFTNNQKMENLILKNTSSGGVCINDAGLQFLSYNLPFGGIGKSGMGAYHRKASFDAFTHYKPVSKSIFNVNLPAFFPPYFKSKWLYKLLK